MTAAPFMQLYVGDYLADTLHLTTEQHGAYLLLLMTMWRAGASLPNDPAKLARIARVSPKRWGQVWEGVAEFFDIEGDTITNRRLTKEHQKAVSISQERKQAGRKGGNANALKTKKPTEANASVLPKHSQISEPYREDKTSYEVSSVPAIDEVSEAVAAFNDTAARAGLSQVQKMSDTRRKAVRQSLKDCGGIDGWRVALSKIEQSDFLTGRNGRWRCDFDWINKPANFTKLMEGNYDNRDFNPSRPAADDPALRAIAIAARGL